MPVDCYHASIFKFTQIGGCIWLSDSIVLYSIIGSVLEHCKALNWQCVCKVCVGCSARVWWFVQFVRGCSMLQFLLILHSDLY